MGNSPSNSIDMPNNRSHNYKSSSNLNNSKANAIAKPAIEQQTLEKEKAQNDDDINDTDEKTPTFEKSNDENVCENMTVPLRNHIARRKFARRLTPPAHPIRSAKAKARMARNTKGARKQASSMLVVTSSRTNVDHTTIENDVLAQAWNTESEDDENENDVSPSPNDQSNSSENEDDLDNQFLNVCEPTRIRSVSDNTAYYLGNFQTENQTQVRKKGVSFNESVVVLRR